MTPEEIIDTGIDVVRKFRLDSWELVRGLCESPIEEMFLATVFAQNIDNHAFPVHLYGDQNRRNVAGDTYDDSRELFHGAHLWPQAKIGNYRVDFLFVNIGKQGRRLVVVECDGHDFHERTKEQAGRDKARDRYLVSRGIIVLRFTGSEIYRDPWVCWTETFNVLWDTRAAA